MIWIWIFFSIFFLFFFFFVLFFWLLLYVLLALIVFFFYFISMLQNLEIPIVSYYRQGQFMELDESIQSEAFAKYNLKAIKEFSPFNKYSIGMKAGLFCEKGTGTQIYIWNLDKWGSDYCLEWHNGMSSGSSFYQGDIFIRSRRVKSRPGQISQKVEHPIQDTYIRHSCNSFIYFLFLLWF